MKLIIDWKRSLEAFDEHGDNSTSTLHDDIFRETPIIYELVLSEALMKSYI